MRTYRLTFLIRLGLVIAPIWGWSPLGMAQTQAAPSPRIEAGDGIEALGRIEAEVGIEAGGFELAGSLRMIDQSSGKPLSLFEQRNAVIYFQPDPLPAATDKPDLAELEALPTQRMLTWRKDFQPRTLALPVGTTVQFPNNDPILHNVFSVSPGNAFDVGLYAKGDGKSFTFNAPGLVRVYCNVHHEMSGHILVLDTPHYMHPDLDGNFRFANLTAVAGVLTVWSDRSAPWSQRVTLPTYGPLTIEVQATRRVVPRHLNKFGRPYKRGNARDDY